MPPGSDSRTTTALMRHSQVGLVLATVGAAMGQAADRWGQAGDRRGSGQRPRADQRRRGHRHAARNAVASKTFDNGLDRAAENNLVVVASVRAR